MNKQPCEYCDNEDELKHENEEYIILGGIK